MHRVLLNPASQCLSHRAGGLTGCPPCRWTGGRAGCRRTARRTAVWAGAENEFRPWSATVRRRATLATEAGKKKGAPGPAHPRSRRSPRAACAGSHQSRPRPRLSEDAVGQTGYVCPRSTHGARDVVLPVCSGPPCHPQKASACSPAALTPPAHHPPA